MNNLWTDEEIAAWIHNVYEEEAINNGWETNKKTRTSFDLLPEANKKTMLALAARLRVKLWPPPKPVQPKKKDGQDLGI